METFDVVGLGMATMDILTVVPRLPESNEVYPVDSMDVQGGGPVATALVALAKLGAATTYLGTIAPDDWGAAIENDFQRYGVDTRWAYHPKTGESSVSVILVEAGLGHRAILYKKGTAPEMGAAKVAPAAIEFAKILHLDGFYLDAALAAARLARSQGVLVSLDGGAGENIWQGMDELLPLVDILVVARQFATSVTGEADPLTAGPALQLMVPARLSSLTVKTAAGIGMRTNTSTNRPSKWMWSIQPGLGIPSMERIYMLCYKVGNRKTIWYLPALLPP